MIAKSFQYAVQWSISEGVISENIFDMLYIDEWRGR